MQLIKNTIKPKLFEEMFDFKSFATNDADVFIGDPLSSSALFAWCDSCIDGTAGCEHEEDEDPSRELFLAPS